MDAVAWLGRTFCQQYAAVTAIVYKKNIQEKAWLIVISHDHGEIAVACRPHQSAQNAIADDCHAESQMHRKEAQLTPQSQAQTSPR